MELLANKVDYSIQKTFQKLKRCRDGWMKLMDNKFDYTAFQTRNYKRFLKTPTKYRDGWIEALGDKVHKQA